MNSRREKILRVSSFANSDANPIDQSGAGILALIQKSADHTNETCDRALSMAHKLALELRAAEERADRLQAQVEQLESDARKAAQWMAQIQNQISEKFFHQQARSYRS
jgi:hypothetical protein